MYKIGQVIKEHFMPRLVIYHYHFFFNVIPIAKKITNQRQCYLVPIIRYFTFKMMSLPLKRHLISTVIWSLGSQRFYCIYFCYVALNSWMSKSLYKNSSLDNLCDMHQENKKNLYAPNMHPATTNTTCWLLFYFLGGICFFLMVII